MSTTSGDDGTGAGERGAARDREAVRPVAAPHAAGVDPARSPRTIGRGFASPAEIDAQYNASAAVADSASYGPRWASESRRARETMRCALDVRYGPTLDETVDVFPAAQAGAPVFVFLHGGYWRAFSSKEFSWVAAGLVPLGITTVVVNYALCPKVTIDEIVRQCRAAIAWTLTSIGAHGGDPARVAVGGHSAGGHLTATSLLAEWDRDWGLPRDPLVAALPISGLYDIEPLRHSYLQPQIRIDDGIAARSSPLLHVRACATPVLVAYGAKESEEFARQAESLHGAWGAAGNRSELLALAGDDHFSAVAGLAQPTSALCRWLAQRLGLPAA